MNLSWIRRQIWEQVVSESEKVVGLNNFRSWLTRNIVRIEELTGGIWTDSEYWNFSQHAISSSLS